MRPYSLQLSQKISALKAHMTRHSHCPNLGLAPKISGAVSNTHSAPQFCGSRLVHLVERLRVYLH